MVAEASYGTPVYRDKDALRVKEGSTGVVETGAIENANTVGQAPVVHRIAIADGTANTDVVLEHKTMIVDVVIVKVSAGGGAGDQIIVQNGANAITNAISLNIVDTTIARPGTINDVYQTINAGGTLRIAATKVTNCACLVFVIGIRVINAYAAAAAGDAAMSLVLKTGPALEPITLVEAKRHLRVELDFLDDDQYIPALIQAARATIEAWEWRSHISQVWELRLDAFPSGADPIYCPRPPLQSVGSIQYVDADGVTQTLAPADYSVDPKSEPGRIMPAYGEVWPTTRSTTMNAVTITYTAGYGGDAQSVPARTKHAIKLLLGLWYENREPVITGTIATQIPETIGALLLPVHSAKILEAVA